VAKAKKGSSEDEFLQIIKNIETRNFANIYLLDGEESYYIDKISDLLEANVCAEHEKDFNQTIMYGKDSNWADVLSACRRYPAFAEKQIVILKEAQSLKDFDNLAIYFEKPMESTVFVVCYRNKTIDGRKAYLKKLTAGTVRFTSNKIREYETEKWIGKYLSSNKISASEKVIHLLATYLGNDLQKIVNEIDKVSINVAKLKELTPELVEKFIGISREYNVFELPSAVMKQDKEATFRILNYFVSNMKDAPMELVLGAFYSNFTKLYKFHYCSGKSDAEVAGVIGINPFLVKDYRLYGRLFNLQRTEDCLRLLLTYNEKVLGFNNAAERSSLLKEMTTRLFFG
jgi:DNA polymerase III subunit delta